MVGELLTGQLGIFKCSAHTRGSGDRRTWLVSWRDMQRPKHTVAHHASSREDMGIPFTRVKETIKQRTPFAPALWMRWDSSRDFRTAPTCLCLEDPIRH